MKEKDYRLVEKNLKEVSLLIRKINYLKNIEGDLNEINRCRKILNGYMCALKSLDKTELMIIKGIYFENKTLTQISEELNYSYCYCSRIKSRAIRNLIYFDFGAVFETSDLP